MKRALFLTPLAALVLSGCMTSPGYRCPIDGTGNPEECASTERAYKAAVASRTGSDQAQSTSVFQSPARAPGQKSGEAAAEPYFTGQATNYPAPPGTGAPVFQQPKVFQPWLAPYVDADGNLRSGEYGYFSTPGRWNYGTLRKPGAASGILEPARPSDLGFAPVGPGVAANKGSTTRLTAPSEPAGQPQVAPAQQPAPKAAITQPYQRLQTE